MQNKNVISHITLLAILICSNGVLLADTSGWTLGIAAGLSQLEPDDSGTPFILEESDSEGLKLSFGYSWSNRISSNFFIADLGEASFQNNSSLSYRVTGLQASYNIPVYSDVSYFFLTGGVARLSNSGDVPFRIEKDTQAFAGAGFMLEMSDKLELKLGFESYQKDFNLAFISIEKKLGKLSFPVPGVNWELFEKTRPNQLIHKNGISPTFSKQTIHHPDILATILGEIKGVDFENGTEKLTPFSKRSLDYTASVINNYFTDLKFLLIGHTDDIGDDNSNRELSYKQAQEVLLYLQKQGVNENNFEIRGDGEIYPLVNNTTPEGRELNRRIEMFLLY